MRRELFWSFLAMFGCLGIAFWASLPNKATQQGSQKVFSIVIDDIQEIDFSGPEFRYSVAKLENPATKSQRGPQWWMTLTKGESSERFLLSSKFDETLAMWESLSALRVVGKADQLNLGDYGLDAPKSTLSIKDKDQKTLIELAIGSESFGSRNLFAMEKSSNMVWLLSDSLLGDLLKPELKFYERTIHSLVFDDLIGASVSSGDKAVTFVREKRDEKGNFVWTKSDVQGEVSVSMKSWMERVDRIRVVSYADESTRAQVEAAKDLFVLELKAPKGRTERLVFRTISGLHEGKTIAEYYVYSGHLGAWAKVGSTRLEPIYTDLPSVLK